MKNFKIIFNLIGILGALTILGCAEKTDPNTKGSKQISEIAERIKTIQHYVKCESDLLDAQFVLFNANGFEKNERRTDIPAPSYWDYKYAVKVPPEQAIRWTNAMVDITMPEDYDDSWIAEIVSHDKENWNPVTTPILALRVADGLRIEMLTYEEEGMIFRREIQQ